MDMLGEKYLRYRILSQDAREGGFFFPLGSSKVNDFFGWPGWALGKILYTVLLCAECS